MDISHVFGSLFGNDKDKVVKKRKSRVYTELEHQEKMRTREEGLATIRRMHQEMQLKLDKYKESKG